MTSADPTFEGVYGPYSITATDRQEVRSYRIALLITGLSLAAGVLQWWQTDSPWAWLWVLPMATALGLALRWSRSSGFKAGGLSGSLLGRV